MSWGNPETTLEKLASSALAPIAALYGAGAYCRLLTYNSNIRQQTTVSKPVISIGNITCGGTGKTPLTIDLAKHLVKKGLRVAVLSRGYRRKSKEQTVIVSDGKGRFSDCGSAGDEPFLIAKSVPEAVVIVGSHRISSAQLAIAHYDCDIILLDDGFQHYQLARTLDIVLVDYADDLERDSLLPAGRLREPVAALSRAQCAVVTKVPIDYDVQRLAQIKQLIRKHAPNISINAVRFPSTTLVNQDGVQIPLQKLNAAKVLVVSALARPEGFVNQIKALKANVVRTVQYSDHHWYSETDLNSISKIASEADFVITTEKDLVKMQAPSSLAKKLYAVRISSDWLDGLPERLTDLANLTSNLDKLQERTT